jgi:hypothetical protein
MNHVDLQKLAQPLRKSGFACAACAEDKNLFSIAASRTSLIRRRQFEQKITVRRSCRDGLRTLQFHAPLLRKPIIEIAGSVAR